jgi:histone acetyltransferase (RNA polymerase elongator complex component)
VGLEVKHVEDTDDTFQQNSSEDTQLQKLHIISEENRNLKISLEEMSFKKLKLEEKVNSISLEFSTKCNNLQVENKSLEDQLTKMSQLTNSKIELGISAIENENLKLQEKVLGLEEEVKALSLEKDSFISTLKLMQDELMQSERLLHQRTSSM